MASVDQYPLEKVVDAVRRVNDRVYGCNIRQPSEAALRLPVDEARMICSAAKWIDIMIISEAKQDNSIEYTFEELFWLMKEKTHDMKLQGPEDKWLWLSGREIKMMMAIEIYLERYAYKLKYNKKDGRRK